MTARAPDSARGGARDSGPSSGFPRIDKYELIEEIGHGGMATVYRARDPRLGREVAVKVIHKHLRENAEVGTRFVAEARAAAKLRHPGIVDVFDVSTEDDLERYLVVELIRGTTLRKVLQDHRDMPAEVGAAIVLQICDALEHAHGLAIIHRDIKPENVLVELPEDRAAAQGRPSSDPRPPQPENDAPPPDAAPPATPPTPPTPRAGDTQPSIASAVTAHEPPAAPHRGRRDHAREPRPHKPPRDDAGVVIKITDFGIAKILDAQSVTSTGQVLGSPAHMAPEQIEGGEVDARTDVFALGVLLYECLVGHLPFEGKNPAQVLRRVLEGLYPAADRERPTVGGRWARIVARALARDAAERTPSAAAMGAEIKAELEALGIADPRAEVVAYFVDPAAYAAAHAGRLTPRVVARGEAARKAGDVPGAAADFNRALALCPTDLAILKRLSSLNQAAGRRLLLRRAGAILAGSAVLGLAAFQIARALKPGPSRHDAAGPQGTLAPDGSSPRFASDGPAPSGEASATPATPTAAPVETTSRRLRVPASPTFTPAPPVPATPSTRTVVFNLSPKGAKLTVDGAPQRSWLSGVSLAVGTHAVVVSPNVQLCCKRLSQTVTVEPAPAGQPDLVQKISLAMEINPATVTLTGAPPNGQLSCPELALTCFAGSQRLVKLNDATWTGGCTFAAPDKPARTARVTINAGENNAVPWPVD